MAAELSLPASRSMSSGCSSDVTVVNSSSSLKTRGFSSVHKGKSALKKAFELGLPSWNRFRESYVRSKLDDPDEERSDEEQDAAPYRFNPQKTSRPSVNYYTPSVASTYVGNYVEYNALGPWNAPSSRQVPTGTTYPAGGYVEGCEECNRGRGLGGYQLSTIPYGNRDYFTSTNGIYSHLETSRGPQISRWNPASGSTSSYSFPNRYTCPPSCYECGQQAFRYPATGITPYASFPSTAQSYTPVSYSISAATGASIIQESISAAKIIKIPRTDNCDVQPSRKDEARKRTRKNSELGNGSHQRPKKRQKKVPQTIPSSDKDVIESKTEKKKDRQSIELPASNERTKTPIPEDKNEPSSTISTTSGKEEAAAKTEDQRVQSVSISTRLTRSGTVPKRIFVNPRPTRPLTTRSAARKT